MYGATIFWKKLHQSIGFWGKTGPQKLVYFSLMKYQLPWIHSCEPNCKWIDYDAKASKKQIIQKLSCNFSGTVDSNDSFSSNLLIEPGQDLSSYPPESSAGNGPPSLPPHHGLPGNGGSDHLPRFPTAAPGGYLVPPRKSNKKLFSSPVYSLWGVFVFSFLSKFLHSLRATKDKSGFKQTFLLLALTYHTTNAME